MPQPVTQSICRSPARTVLALLALSCAAGPARAQFAFDTLNDPFVVSKRHDVGKHLFSVSNTGRLSGPLLSGGLWVGAVVGTDTLVTTTWDGWRFNLSEFEPATLRAQEEFGEFPIERDIFDTLADDHNLAKSQQDFIVTYYDTLEVDDFSDFDGRPHRPLNLRVRQSSYAWGMDYADDFVLVDYLFTNLGKKTLTKLYLGMFLDGRDAGGVDSYDWVQGFLGEGDAFFPDSVACSFRDPVNFAWYADVDGLSINAQTGAVDSTGNRAAAGFKILRPVDPLLNLNFNWWLSSQEKHQDFGPRKILSNGRPFRDFGGFLGTPEGDKNKYHQLSNGERDYDQVYTAVDHSGDGWLLPPPDAADIANGRFDTHEVISIGPFELSPGQSVPFTVALFVGENFHRDPANFSENYDPLAPDAYYENLDFSGLIESATWARWVYDNPGVDTDGDGFRGEYRVCVSEVELNVDTSFVIDSSGPAPDTQLVVDTTELAPREDTVW
ncbi:MAG: hypothetical protein ACE5GA_11290, partial [Candidatus Zixiibacteriota bacterium]